jgi:hypothetical protein
MSNYDRTVNEGLAIIEGLIILSGFLFLCCVVMWISDEEVTTTMISHAQSLCEDNDGLKKIEVNLLSYDIRCYNSATFHTDDFRAGLENDYQTNE